MLACAPLHPKLPFVEANMYGLVPLFRRAPDPTIQWVRLDGLEALYAGRGSDNQYLQVQDIESFVRSARLLVRRFMMLSARPTQRWRDGLRSSVW